MLLGAGSDRLHCKQTGANYDEIFSLFFLAFKSTNEFNMCNFLEKILVYVICLFLNHFEWRLRYLCTLETSLKNTFGGKKNYIFKLSSFIEITFLALEVSFMQPAA